MFFDNVPKSLQTPNGVQSMASAAVFNLWRPDRLGNPSSFLFSDCQLGCALLTHSRADPRYVQFASWLWGTRNSLRTWTCTVTQTGRTNKIWVTEFLAR